MVEIRPRKGAPWQCTADHILTLTRTRESRRYRNRSGEVIDIPVNEFRSKSKTFRHIHKLFRVYVPFNNQFVPLDPYSLGVFLGDGSLTRYTPMVTTIDPEIVEWAYRLAPTWGLSITVTDSNGQRPPTYSFARPSSGGRENPLMAVLRMVGATTDSGNKYIPHVYRTGDITQRLELLAGLMDTDGSLGNGHFDYLTKSPWLADGVAFVARSCGFSAYMASKFVSYKNERRLYWRVSIGGDIDRIPTRISRKQARPRRQKKSVLRTGFRVVDIGNGPWHGFTLEGDGRFLLEDFTVTHNTRCGLELVIRAYERGRRSLFLVDGIDLLDQTSERFLEAGLPHAVFGGGPARSVTLDFEPADRPRDNLIQLWMKQTLAKRGWPPGVDLVIDDEMHVRFQYLQHTLRALACPVVGLTATAMVRGLGNLDNTGVPYYESVYQPVTTNQLFAAHRLAPFVTRPCIEINTDGLPLIAGEWGARDIQQRGRRIIGDIVSTWVEQTDRWFGGPVPTLAFTASIAHGEEICAAFQRNGIDARQVTAHDERSDRRDTMDAFRRGDFPIACSVSALGKGVDLPNVMCLIMARPFNRAFAALIQMIGRLLRTEPSGRTKLLLDFSSNMEWFWHDITDFFENGVTQLDDSRWTQVRRPARKPPDTTCRGCGYLYPPGADTCLVCGRVRKRKNEITTVPGTVVEIDPDAGKLYRIEPVRKGRVWIGNEASLWKACCAHAGRFLDQHGDLNRAERHARAAFQDLAGERPSGHLRFIAATYVPKTIARRLAKLYREHKKRQQQAAQERAA